MKRTAYSNHERIHRTDIPANRCRDFHSGSDSCFVLHYTENTDSTVEYNSSVRFLAIACLALLIIVSSTTSQELDQAYHSFAEVESELFRFQEEYPDWISIDSIGHSQQRGLPIWAAKLSDNPDRIESEPSLLFIGQVHAEEVIGVEITLEMMRILLENADREEYRDRLEDLELYFIPTANPEGLEVVHSGADVTYRKNMRDNVGDGEFRYREGAGWDTSGVDLNRNFSIHWNRGDTLFQIGENPPLNYYRGPTPASEPETRALIRLAEDVQFMFSISYHSSRSGNNSELVIAPWNWDGKYPPDYRAIDAMMEALAARIPSQDGFGTYVPVHGMQRNGQTPDWFYQATGCFQYMVEVGEDIQPDSAVLRQIVEDNLPSALFMMDVARCGEEVEGFGVLTITAMDGLSANRLGASVVVERISDPIIEPRMTDSIAGRYDWFLPDGSYDVTVKRRGYHAREFEDVEIRSGARNSLLALLQPRDEPEVNLIVLNALRDEAIEARVTMDDGSDFPPFTFTAPREGYVSHFPANIYDVQVAAPGFAPYLGVVDLQERQDLAVRLYPAETTYDEEFDEFGNWQFGGFGDEWGIVEAGGRTALTESVSGEYPTGSTVWLMLDTGVVPDSSHSAVLQLIHRPYFEPGADFGTVKVWNWRQNLWSTLDAFSGFPAGWDTTYMQINFPVSGSIRVRFEIESDGALNEDGWLIDRLTVLQSERPNSVETDDSVQGLLEFYSHPNPFNGSAEVVLNLQRSVAGQLTLYNSNGREIADYARGSLKAGRHRYLIDGSLWPSGSYYLRFSSGGDSRMIRLIFLR